MIIFNSGPAHGVTLFLSRAPFLLRVTQDQGQTDEWDALDQLDDKPSENESIFLYYALPSRMGRAFYDGTKNGRRHGWSSICAGYQYFTPQPPDSVMRDNNEWVLWCAASVQNPDMAQKFEAWKEANKPE